MEEKDKETKRLGDTEIRIPTNLRVSMCSPAPCLNLRRAVVVPLNESTLVQRLLRLGVVLARQRKRP